MYVVDFFVTKANWISRTSGEPSNRQYQYQYQSTQGPDMVCTYNAFYFFFTDRPRIVNPTVGAPQKSLECEDPNGSRRHVVSTFPNLSLGSSISSSFHCSVLFCSLPSRFPCNPCFIPISASLFCFSFFPFLPTLSSHSSFSLYTSLFLSFPCLSLFCMTYQEYIPS